MLSTLALVAVMGGSPPLVGDGTESAADTGAADTRADASSWSPLPAGFLPGDGRILIERDGTVLRADFPKSFDVVGHQEARVRVGGDLSFSLVGRGDGGAGATLTILRLGTPGDRIAVNVIVEVRLRVQESVVPARFEPRAHRRLEDHRIAFLGIAGGGDDVARGLYDSTRDEGIDCSGIDPHFKFRLLPAESPLPESTTARRRPEERIVRISGSVPRGRELVLFDWRLKSGVLGASRERAASNVSYHGWRLSGLSGRRLQRAVEALEKETLLGSASYVEIGDGWQSRRSGGRFARLERNWLASLPPDPQSRDSARDGRTSETDSSEKSRGRGGERRVASVEPTVRSLIERGLRPGLWLVPHGQTADAVFDERPDAFVRDGKGRAIAGNYLGKYVVDPTGAAGEAYLRELFRRLRATGTRVFRIAGLERAVIYYRVNRRALQNGSANAIEIVGRSLAAMRAGAGTGAILAGEYGTPKELAAALDAVRPGVADGQSFTDLQREGLAASTWLAMHRHLLEVESLPLAPRFFVNDRDDLGATLRSYLLFAALTGRGVILDGADILDGTWEVPATVRPLFQQVREPPVVYPLDVFPREKAAPIWVVKPSGTDPDRSVVGLFNWSDLSATTLDVTPSELGLRRTEVGGKLLWFDLVSERFVGSGWLDRDFFLLPGHSRFLALSLLREVPRVVAVSGHVLGRELFLRELSWNPDARHLSGRLRLDAPQTARRLHIAVAPGLRPVQVEADGGTAGFEVSGGHVVVTIDSPKDDGGRSAGPRTVSFRLEFEPAAEPTPPPGPGGIDKLAVRYERSARRPLLSWQLEDRGHEAWPDGSRFEILRNGRTIGQTTDTQFLDDGVEWGGRHAYRVRRVGEISLDAPASVDPVEETFSFPDHEDTRLVNLYPRAIEEKSGAPARLRSATGGPLLVGGRRVRDGWGVRPPSRMDFRIDGGFAEFRAGIGVDDAAQLQGSVVFVVLVDGGEAYRSPLIVGDGRVPREINVDIRAGKVLSLIVEDGGDGVDWDYADWCEPRLIVTSSP